MSKRCNATLKGLWTKLIDAQADSQEDKHMDGPTMSDRQSGSQTGGQTHRQIHRHCDETTFDSQARIEAHTHIPTKKIEDRHVVASEGQAMD